MLVKAVLEVSEEQGGDVGVTESALAGSWRRPLVSLVFLSTLVLLACGVELKESTPGALRSCNPSTAEASDFVTNVYNTSILGNPTTCTGCHGGTNPAGNLLLPTTLTTFADQKETYCALRARGETAYTFPQSSGHPVQATAASLVDLINWINSQMN